ncbi:helix-turn-helix transcriptional regulator [Lactococcus garvieae]|uniref:helix-turn-helix transcriptional regulator n=1 Tax=Lactococcus garvieae TaxID=1363 RepID=UPI0037C6FC15
MPENFKLTLAALRVNKGFTQEQMAKELEIHKNTWMNWEAGKTFPDIPELKKIEEYFGIDYRNINFYP